MSVCGLLKFKNHLLVVLMGESLDWSRNQVRLLWIQQVERGTFLEWFSFHPCSLRKRQGTESQAFLKGQHGLSADMHMVQWASLRP